MSVQCHSDSGGPEVLTLLLCHPLVLFAQCRSVHLSYHQIANTALLYLHLGGLSLGWTNICLSVLLGLKCTGMQCLLKTLRGLSDTPAKYGIIMPFCWLFFSVCFVNTHVECFSDVFVLMLFLLCPYGDDLSLMVFWSPSAFAPEGGENQVVNIDLYVGVVSILSCWHFCLLQRRPHSPKWSSMCLTQWLAAGLVKGIITLRSTSSIQTYAWILPTRLETRLRWSHGIL